MIVISEFHIAFHWHSKLSNSIKQDVPWEALQTPGPGAVSCRATWCDCAVRVWLARKWQQHLGKGLPWPYWHPVRSFPKLSQLRISQSFSFCYALILLSCFYEVSYRPAGISLPKEMQMKGGRWVGTASDFLDKAAFVISRLGVDVQFFIVR